MKKAKKHSVKGIAEKLNISPTTVSFVLNGKAKEKKISDEMIERVLAYVKEINYKPNQLAQSLRTGKSKIIVFMVEDISNHFFASIARKIEDLAYEKDYKVLFCSNENRDKKSRDLIQLFKDRQVDGYIINPSPGIRDDIEKLITENIPVILFDRYFPGLKTNYVGIDNEEASYRAALHLIENGFKKIGFITLATDQTQMANRKKGYLKAINENGFAHKVLEIEFEGGNHQRRKELIKDFIFKEDLDAIYFSTNYLTQSGLEVFKENSPELIDKFGILTFDDHEFFKIHTPTISAIAQPKDEMASELMKLMLGMLKNSNKNLPSKEIILSAKLFPRNSTIQKGK
ncbi:LacI family DNA-binding transcriptional regulator [Salegentibacter sp. Hel_I_6]|uniref:LacI family DNA-binding transcriptional regulator n=1 Tax=Salegentibacter sp. Hel_I_6 TaxID=1250278 RepID=UPI00056855A0|nr:LacI family DNA-binding transcriptional regulator [Salegentibacter sp. Hel_I_6]